MKKRIWGILVGISLTVFAVAASAQGAPPARKPSGATKPAASSATYDKALLSPSTLIARAPETFDVKFVTTEGDFVVHVTRAWCPRGADRFYNLVRHKYFDGAAFFRVLKGFMAQFGMSAFPEVTQAWDNATIKDDPVKQSNTRGKITFATAGPNTRTTQLFINFGNNSSSLDGQGFAPFGEVTLGMDVVDKLYSGYGDGPPDGTGPDQAKVTKLGRPYLEKNFPKLSIIKSTTLVTAPPAGAATKPSTKP
jgi:peptidyl-prolyl cis-trans isomerase A (cyclophilin A)